MQESQRITQKSASNLALAFILLPKAQREGMSALYAFCREVDDLTDDDGIPLERRRRGLAEWREDIRRTCEGGNPEKVVNRELQPVIKRCHLRYELFDELIQGVEMDLDIKRYADWDQLELYCYRVASVVGLLSIEIFGYKTQACRDYAIYLGKALQLTNILRDVRVDAERGRIYLPAVELERFKVDPGEILALKYSDRFARLAGSVAARAKDFYNRAQRTLPAEDRRSMVAAELMGTVYSRLLKKLERERFQVFGSQATRLSKPHKVALVLKTRLRLALGGPAPDYGF
jgi:phytoene synthase